MKIPRFTSQGNLSVTLCVKCGSHVRDWPLCCDSDMQQRSAGVAAHHDEQKFISPHTHYGFNQVQISEIMGEHVPSYRSCRCPAVTERPRPRAFWQIAIRCLNMAAQSGMHAHIDGMQAPHRRGIRQWVFERSAIAGRIGFQISVIGARRLVHTTTWISNAERADDRAAKSTSESDTSFMRPVVCR
jgi:hypothetical protein